MTLVRVPAYDTAIYASTGVPGSGCSTGQVQDTPMVLNAVPDTQITIF